MSRKSVNQMEIDESDDDYDEEKEEDDENLQDTKIVEFLNSTQMDTTITQSANERRQLRQDYRTLIEETEKIAEDLDAATPNDLKKQVEKASTLFDKVKLPREGAYDTFLLKQCSDLGKKKASVLQTGFQQFNEDNFAKQIISFIKNEEIDMNSSADDETTSCDRRNSRSDNILSKIDWENFGKIFASQFKIAPGLNFLSTCLERDPTKIKKVERKKREPRQKDALGEVVNVKKITSKSDETEDEKTTKFVENVHRCLKITYERLGNSPISYFDFIVNPQSFEKTIENMFHFSFLIKDGFAKMTMDAKGYPTIEPIDKNPDSSCCADEGKRNQCIISLNYDEWKEIIEVFQIEDTLIM